MTPHSRSKPDHGQVLVIMAIGLAVMLALVGLVIDGGNAWGQQRSLQNGTDAAAQAGATVLAKRLGGAAEPGGGWDAAVLAAVNGAASANRNGTPAAYYTDICGLLLTSTGGAASSTATAARVGSGFPTSSAITPDCPNRVPGPVAGVHVEGTQIFSTYFAGVVGIRQMTAGAAATAVTGFVESCQDVEQGCAVLPITAPVWPTVCVGPAHRELFVDSTRNWPQNVTVTVPMCSNSPGNVGWLDFTPPAGGASEVRDCVEDPCNSAIDLPSWQYITQTGKINSAPVENALRQYIGQVVLFPLFDHVCGDSQPDQTQAATPPSYGCTTIDDAQGQNLWYRIPQFAAFLLEGAYTNGNNLEACNGVGTECLVGKFVKFVVSGQVGPGAGGGSTQSSVIGVQLIK